MTTPETILPDALQAVPDWTFGMGVLLMSRIRYLAEPVQLVGELARRECVNRRGLPMGIIVIQAGPDVCRPWRVKLRYCIPVALKLEDGWLTVRSALPAMMKVLTAHDCGGFLKELCGEVPGKFQASDWPWDTACDTAHLGEWLAFLREKRPYRGPSSVASLDGVAGSCSVLRALAPAVPPVVAYAIRQSDSAATPSVIVWLATDPMGAVLRAEDVQTTSVMEALRRDPEAVLDISLAGTPECQRSFAAFKLRMGRRAIVSQHGRKPKTRM